jgi:hypothetical protein
LRTGQKGSNNILLPIFVFNANCIYVVWSHASWSTFLCWIMILKLLQSEAEEKDFEKTHSSCFDHIMPSFFII